MTNTNQSIATVIFETCLGIKPNERVACELGIGTNPKAILSSEILESEKVHGTCHIAFGKNDTFGGVNDAPFHADGLIKYPVLSIDDTIILDNGVLRI